MNLVINAQLHRTQQSASLILISGKKQKTNPSLTLRPWYVNTANAEVTTLSPSHHFTSIKYILIAYPGSQLLLDIQHLRYSGEEKKKLPQMYR